MSQATTQQPVLLELLDRTGRYRQQTVLRDINIRIRPGERVAILGKSGVGKSTLIKLLYQSLTQTGANTTAVALIPQQPGLVDRLSAWHNIYMGRLPQYSALYNLRNLLLRDRARDQEIHALAARLEIEHHLLQPCGELSGGQQQRVALCRALYSQAPVLLADEPLAHLDEVMAARALTIMTEQFQSCVFALHNLDQALQFCDRLIGLRDGRIELDCATESADAGEIALLYSDDC